MISTTPAMVIEAMKVATTHRHAFWDSIMLAAAQANCRMLLSKDLRDGLT